MNARLDYSNGDDLVIGTSDRLRIARLKAGLEQDEMAEILGVSSSTISNWEHGRTKPKAAFVKVWAQVTGFNLDSLVSQDDRERLAQPAKRDKTPRPENTGQGVSQLPRMDSNHQPCGSANTQKRVVVSTRNVGHPVYRRNIRPRQLVFFSRETLHADQHVSWTRLTPLANLEAALTTLESEAAAC